MLRFVAWVAALAVWIAAAACLSPPVESPKTNVIQDTPVRVPQNAQNRVDVLFMVDNSPSMEAMQDQLKAHFGDFFKVFTDLASKGTYADLHIGVVTSDYGASSHNGPLGSGCFAAPGPDQGHLKAIGNAADATTCKPPNNGVPFIQYAFDPNGGAATSNLPAGQDLLATFTCMASTGAKGCGFEHQLESVYAALKNTNENKGFLRPDALLTVVFVTNEDDGSAAPNSQVYEPDNSLVAMYGPYDTYRQTRFAVDCGGNPIPYVDGAGNAIQATYTGCAAAPNPMTNTNLAYDISRYTTLFTQPLSRGGVKALPTDVILFGIDGPETPFSTLLAVLGSGNGTTTTPTGMPTTEEYSPCNALGTNCVLRLQHSCQNHKSKAFFADPPIRLNAVINSAAHHQVTSICGNDLDAPPDYTNALQTLGALISSQIKPGCIPAPLQDVNNPKCVVSDVTTNPDLTQTVHPIPECDNSKTYPCWRVEKKGQCSEIDMTTMKAASPQGVGVTIDRNGMMAAANTAAQVECETVPTTM